VYPLLIYYEKEGNGQHCKNETHFNGNLSQATTHSMSIDEIVVTFLVI
jgi:hypothetical protein